MKVFGCLFILALFGNISAVPAVKSLSNESVKTLIDMLFNVCVPDNLEDKDIHLKFAGNNYISGVFDINDVSISKLNDVEVDVSSVDDTYIIHINFSDITVHLNSLLNLIFYNTYDIVRDEVDIRIDLKNLKVTLYATPDGENLFALADLRLKVHISESDIVVQGLLENDALNKKVSNLLSSSIPILVNNFYDEIADELSEAVKNQYNKFLEI